MPKRSVIRLATFLMPDMSYIVSVDKKGNVLDSQSFVDNRTMNIIKTSLVIKAYKNSAKPSINCKTYKPDQNVQVSSPPIDSNDIESIPLDLFSFQNEIDQFNEYDDNFGWKSTYRYLIQ